MPERYRLSGIQFALRYIADGEFSPANHRERTPRERGELVNYRAGDLVQQTHEDFMALGPRLAEMGRHPEVRAYT